MSLHDHETRISILEKDCSRFSDKFLALFEKLDEIQSDIHSLDLQNAKNKGFSSAIWGGVAGGVVLGVAKVLAILRP